jgi:hypothetical protein
MEHPLSPFMSVFLSRDPLAYTGSELRPHFLLEKFGLEGSAIGAFIGPCRVETGALVDWEDRLAHDRIEAKSMIHFIGEFFGSNLKEGVYRQRLFMAHLKERLEDEGVGSKAGTRLTRTGDDLWMTTGSQDKRKLSVSIVTSSPVSVLMHVGINIDPSGAPVAAIGLSELGVDPLAWAERSLKSYAEEWKSLEWACTKVRAVVD